MSFIQFNILIALKIQLSQSFQINILTDIELKTNLIQTTTNENKTKIKYPITLGVSTSLPFSVLLSVYKYPLISSFFISPYHLPLYFPSTSSAVEKWIHFFRYSLPLVCSSFHILKLILILPLNITASLTRAILCCN